jgi:hypothetical protein
MALHGVQADDHRSVLPGACDSCTMRDKRVVPGLSSPFALTRLGLLLSRDPYAGLQRMYAKNGPVSGFGFGPVKYVLMLGPEANAFLFANSGLFTWREAFDVLVPVNGATSLIVSDAWPLTPMSSAGSSSTR